MPRYTIHPWRTHTDLLTVRDQLYHLDTPAPDARRYAVDRILSCWKFRGNLPHAVESTALLIDAQLHHQSQNSERSDFALRAVYTAAFTRFVTGFCDIGRSREGLLQPSSMLDVAKRIGMPVHFVGLRHEAVHEELPSLGRLVGAVDEGLRWLWEVYWSRLEVSALNDVESNGRVDDGELKDEVRRVLKAFRSSRRDAFRTNRQREAEHQSEVEAFAQACGRILDGDSRDRQDVEMFATVLVDERFLVPSSRSLGDSMDGAFTLWDPLLSRLIQSQRRFPATLVERLHTQLTESTVQSSKDVASEAFALWLLHALELANTYATHGSTDASLQAATLRVCCLYPGSWTKMVGQRLLEGDAELMADYQALFEASVLVANSETMEVDTEVGTAHDGGPSELPFSTRDELVAVRYSALHDHSTAAVGWRRALFAPSVPIGIVA
ncbi:rRNA-processing protein las1 [Friedmanniomyces endolithicus]|uniref:rRNA-processing protein las1 n=1 Tax=Friedmanniomyces endolithicus TaxID=329885 RepID=A0AAN6H4V8_9PEZI|nr:rRNA-processing protein las1 [Friedmanniomyces endolithicus]KAK0768773.1 rRNA-processing protein las1 [Friedmanniomyces endolithicus]KAK0771340.1 rRNA-processing protein las1 [Friedmanniomyces endolithicus]KAK0777110.1 rRNA-processing protein las1 [Friedmanniomyces endolithicus]KAK0826304.1 rRNA-processing protein las1 [Friedmanniomyces endolithicus]